MSFLPLLGRRRNMGDVDDLEVRRRSNLLDLDGRGRRKWEKAADVLEQEGHLRDLENSACVQENSTLDIVCNGNDKVSTEILANV